jgi:predicted dehydrogenase
VLRVGIVGLGFMGMVHFHSYRKITNAQVLAICTPEPERRAGDWRGIKGNFGPAGEIVDLTGVATYSEVDQLLADDNIDLVDITLPPALHADVCIKALAAGKQVFCEKPMALTIADCERMVPAAEQNKRLLLIGHVLPYFPEYRWARDVINSGQYGRLVGGSFKRVIADPKWLANYWNANQVGGPMLDLHVHDAHFIRLLFGLPVGVMSWGKQRDGLAEHWHTKFDYGSGGPSVHSVSGTINQQGRPFDHGFEIQLERATLCFEFAVINGAGAYLCPPTLLKEDGSIERPDLGDGDPMAAFEAELREVVTCIDQGRTSDTLGADLARDAIRLCHAEEASLHSGRSISL